MTLRLSVFLLSFVLAISCKRTTDTENDTPSTGRLIPQPFKENNNKIGYVDVKGETVIEPQFDAAEDFSTLEVAKVKVGEKWGFINRKGEFVVKPTYDDEGNFSDPGLAPVLIGDKWGYIDLKGEIKIALQFETADEFAPEGVAAVTLNGKKRWVNLQGILSDPGNGEDEVIDHSIIDNQSFVATYKDINAFEGGVSLIFTDESGKEYWFSKFDMDVQSLNLYSSKENPGTPIPTYTANIEKLGNRYTISFRVELLDDNPSGETQETNILTAVAPVSN